MSEENKSGTNQVNTPAAVTKPAETTTPQTVLITPAPVVTKPTEPELPVDNLDNLKEDELEVLKRRAKSIGLTFHPSIGVDALREKINLKLRSTDLKDVTVEAGAVNVNDVEPKESFTEYSTEELTSGFAAQAPVKLNKIQMRNEAIKNANKLVRIRVVNMNPNKRDWAGEIITVSNSVVGTFRKFVPFNIPEGYHVPQMILQALYERKCQIFVNGTNAQGQRIKRAQNINEFAIEVLPPLSVNEIKELAQRQAMASGTAQ